jgi:ribosomal protein S18 acetylase RimI-like enzyme
VSRVPTAPATAVRIGPLRQAHRPALAALLEETGFFRPAEIAVALEVLDAHLQHPDLDYAAVGAFTPGGNPVGYAVWGPTPCTAGTFDLYWIAVSPAVQGAGVGSLLLTEVERRLARTDARLVIVETSSQPLYEPTRAFYVRRGYDEVARVPHFYADGDDRMIFAKRIRPFSPATAPGSQASLLS